MQNLIISHISLFHPFLLLRVLSAFLPLGNLGGAVQNGICIGFEIRLKTNPIDAL